MAVKRMSHVYMHICTHKKAEHKKQTTQFIYQSLSK